MRVAALDDEGKTMASLLLVMLRREICPGARILRYLLKVLK